MTNKQMVQKIIDWLYEHYQPIMSLEFTNPWELLVATILSAQARDEKVNQVTKRLFVLFPKPIDFANGSLESIEKTISSLNYYRSKAKHIYESARIIQSQYNGKVPQTMEELTSLPGVARKTANVVLNIAFNQSVGIVVDTHVLRLSNRLGFIQQQDREKAEIELMKVIPKKNWIDISLLLIHHGRAQCTARNPSCDICYLRDLCPSFDDLKK